ncbi:MAG TPA: hypothetical protein VLN61_02980 [Pseudolabrys sp.]|nr:hypothetical protein [Pseudolabrys sp.]
MKGGGWIGTHEDIIERGTLAERRDRVFNDGATLFLMLHGRALLLGLPHFTRAVGHRSQKIFV